MNAIAGNRETEQLNFTGGGNKIAAALTLAADKSFDGMKCVAIGVTTGDAQEEELLGVALVEDLKMYLPLSQAKDCALVYAVNGDTSADGQVNLTDLMQTLHHVSGRNEFGALEQGISDVDVSGDTNLTDLMKVLHYVSGRSETL